MFKDCRTLEELKKKYHELVLKHHPDRGGNLEMMQAVNVAYDKWFPLLKNKHMNRAGEMYEKQSDETPEYFRDIIDRLMKFEGTYIEIIGSFIWVTGNTKPYKDSIKEMGFKWHTKKLCWYLPPEGYRKFGKKEYSLDDIRGMYGTKGFQAHGSMKLEAEAV